MSEWLGKNVWQGFGTALVCALVLLGTAALLVTRGALGGEPPLYLIHGAAVMLGCAVALRQTAAKRLLHALVVGALYMAVLFLLSLTAGGEMCYDRHMLLSLLAVLLACLGASLLRSGPRKRKKKTHGAPRRTGKRAVT